MEPPDVKVIRVAVRPTPAGRAWSEVREAFLGAVDARQRPLVAGLLARPHDGGVGLRMWLRLLAVVGGPLPAALPPDLVRVYLDDTEAVPLHDCADCGLAVPVHPSRHGYEGEPDHVYFPTCPSCGGRTGRHAYWAHRAGG